MQSNESRRPLKMRPLDFLPTSKTPTKRDEIEQKNSDYSERKFYLESLFEKTTQSINESHNTPKSSSHRVYVEDTPVDYYGLSVIERRKLGLNC